MIKAPYRRLGKLLVEAGAISKAQQKKEKRIDQAKGAAPLESNDNSVVQMVNSLLHQAASQGASDIHLEPTENNLRVRLRIDGVLYDVAPIPKDVLLLVTSRIKILAGMDIAEKRLPQDANFQFKWQDRLLNIRVSTMPTIYGEKVVLRILDPHKIDMPINKLGFQKDNLQRYLSFLHNSFGMILVTGPTGCGKTTTLYSTLNHINSAEKNIITIEDPVEYRLPGINQVQINNKIKLTFANCLRAILRQDPNIIMVGEIRDAETAEIAARAALTGHLVFSTLHTNDAPRAVTRLLDMGVEPFLLVSSLVGVVSQRLIRIICPHCKEEDELEKDEELLYKKISRKNSLPVFYRGRGCPKCNFTGFKGRTAIHEVMPVDSSLREIILQKPNFERVRNHALSNGMQPLIMDGIGRAVAGITTFKEVIRAAYSSFYDQWNWG